MIHSASICTSVLELLLFSCSICHYVSIFCSIILHTLIRIDMDSKQVLSTHNIPILDPQTHHIPSKFSTHGNNKGRRIRGTERSK